MTDQTAIATPPVLEGLPASIRLFERLQGSALVLGWANATLIYRQELHDRLSPFVFTAALCMISALVFFLIARISRRRSTRCKWILIVLSAAGVAPWFALLRHTGATQIGATQIGAIQINVILSLAQGALQFGSCALLVAADSRAWFASREND
jgi:hypothetical protein